MSQETTSPVGGNTRLSYSSGTVLKNCEQKYYHYKVAGTAKDPDADDNYDAFNVGKAFHQVMEDNNHTEDKLEELLDASCKAYEVDRFKPMIHAMLLRYLQVHKKSGLEVVACETAIETDIFVGYIDAIMTDDNGNWWVVDLKTAARFSETTASKLHNDVQLNLYSHFAKDIAPHLGLDPSKFAGARYRTTTKSKLIQKKTESYKDYVIRMAKGIKSYDIIIHRERLSTDIIFEEHKKLHAKSMLFRSGELEPVKNLSYCDSFFRPCEYFSQCHGATYTQCKNAIQMITTDDV